ncbi:alkane 1-monooxygenase [Thalassorhabdomicrobium marinisediminis]|uniref:alkane 1-monooxygenase n=1 Tax=Thalassorhabdomicrobium marinisediminis TaxID=2170577 RepID=UPI002491F448|nr:alkane 1-monooxygenase [Thalassorhabdomicrobium marinisediminis]
MPHPLPVFYLATLTAPLLVAAGALWGGIWSVAGVLWMTALTALLDRLVSVTLPVVEGDEFPAADHLTRTLALAHFLLWLLVIAALSGWTGLGGWEKLGVFLGAGLFMGQVSNSNAHELIHRPARHLRRLGRWVYISLLFGHHASAHPLVHHVHVGTRADPSTARLGEGFYRFWGRAWIGGFRDGLRAETRRSVRSGRPRWRHPYLGYLVGAVAVLLIAFVIGGGAGVLWAVLLAIFAQSQLMLSDYVQHYGLQRKIGADGRAEPVGPKQSWNAPQPASSALMLNAPRHSDHHCTPNRAFPGLVLDADMPMLPRSLPVMASLALVPPLWKRVMNPRAARWRVDGGGGGDVL